MKNNTNYKIAIISNVLFEPYLQKYIKSFFVKSKQPDILFISCYDLHQCHSDLKDVNMVVVYMNFELLCQNISKDVFLKKYDYYYVLSEYERKCRELYLLIKQQINIPIIWFGFEDYFCNQSYICGYIPAFDGLVDRLNLKLIEILRDDIFVDFKKLIAKVGISKAYDHKGKYRWNAPYSKELICVVAEEIHKQYLISLGSTPKCLVVDCDNVLWGGIIEQDGIEGIQIASDGLGRPFQDFQRFLLELFFRGVILAVCSKNDETEVLKIFREHTGMLLKEEHISCFKCNWDNKPENIKAIANELNIGLDSMVFVDDSIFEIESVKSVLPEVRTVLYNRDSIYQDLSCFNLKSNVSINTVMERTTTYKTNAMREKLKSTSKSFSDYISSLNMNIDIHKTCLQELSRVAELTQRTNKFTNGTRYTLEQLKTKFNDENYQLYTVCLSDKFSNLGIVGAIGIYGKTVDLFSLSCRALGRNVEYSMLDYLLQRKTSDVLYTSTTKNQAIKDFFCSNKYKIVELQWNVE